MRVDDGSSNVCQALVGGAGLLPCEADAEGVLGRAWQILLAASSTRNVNPRSSLLELNHPNDVSTSVGPCYWRAYSGIMRGQMYGVHASRRQVEASPLGVAIMELFQFGPVDWDRGWVRRVMMSKVIPAMETFVWARHGWKWTRLDALINAFDDRAALATEVGGFGAHVLDDAAGPASLVACS